MSSIKWIETKDYEDLSKKACDIFVEQLQNKPNSVIGLATGSTPIGLYKELVQQYLSGNVSFKDVVSFNLDEYVGIDPNNEASYHYFMNYHLFKHIDIQKENIHIPEGHSSDLETACRTYEQQIKEAGGIDLQVLGIGVNGHIGFNEPGTPFDSLTHIVELTQSTIEANQKYFEKPEDMPRKAITMGIQSILNAKKIILLISGETKQEAYDRLRTGIITEDLPASALHQHPDVTVIYTGVK